MSRLHWLPKDLRRLIGSFVDDLRPLRQATRDLWNGVTSNNAHIELEVLLDRTKLQAFYSSFKTFVECDMKPPRLGPYNTGDIVPHSTADRALHDAVVLSQSPVLWQLLCDRGAVKPWEIVYESRQHHVNPFVLFAFVDPICRANNEEWNSIQDCLLHLFLPSSGLGHVTCSHCQLSHRNQNALEYGVPIVHHYVVECNQTRMLTRVWSYLCFNQHEWTVLISALFAFIDQYQVFSRSAFAKWIRNERMMCRINGYGSTGYLERLDKLYKWLTE